MSEKQYRTLMLPPTGKKRDDYFDIVRGIAVFLMLWGHSIQYSSCGTFDFLKTDYISLFIPSICLFSCY